MEEVVETKDRPRRARMERLSESTDLGSRSIPEIAAALRAFGLKVEIDPGEYVEPEEEQRGCDQCGYTGWIVWAEWDRRKGANNGAKPCRFCMGPTLSARELARIFADAHVPREYVDATFETYRQLPLTGTQPAALDAAMAYAEKGTGSILFWGDLGTGKTALALAIGKAIVERERCPMLYITTLDLLGKIRSTFNDKSEVSEDQLLSTVKEVELLVLDELGIETIYQDERGDWTRAKLYEIINYRHIEHMRTIYTSNMTLEALGGRISERVAYRIKDHCDPNIVRVDGTNFRDMSRAERAALISGGEKQEWHQETTPEGPSPSPKSKPLPARSSGTSTQRRNTGMVEA